MNQPSVHVDSIRVAYGDRIALDEVSLVVPQGSITAVVGPSGCGKSTLLRAIAGLEPIRSGRIEIDGLEVSSASRHTPPERRRMGLVPQEGALFDHLSVSGNIGFGLGPWWRRAPGTRERINELLAVTGLTDLATRRPSTLSGGQRQRVALARALAPRPVVIGLDEPFSALDADLRTRLQTHVRDTLLSENATGLLVTHDREEALAMADHIVVLIDGRVRQDAPPQVIYAEPADLDVARLFGDLADVAATARGTIATTGSGQLVLRRAHHGEGRVVIRPHDLCVVTDDDAPDALVGDVRFRGSDILISATTSGGDAIVITGSATTNLPTRGERIRYRQQTPLHFLPTG